MFHFPLPEQTRLRLSWLASVTWDIYFSKHQAALKRMSSDQTQPWLLLRTARGYDPQWQTFLTLSVTGWQQSGVGDFLSQGVSATEFHDSLKTQTSRVQNFQWCSCLSNTVVPPCARHLLLKWSTWESLLSCLPLVSAPEK